MMDLESEFALRSGYQASDIHAHLGYMRDLVVELGALVVIELGVRAANSTVAWLAGLEATGGYLWSVDVAAAMTAIDHDRWTFVQGDDMHPAVMADLPPKADILFIDTSHQYQHTLAELRLYGPLVRAGGRIVLHDTELAHPDGDPDPEPYPVRRAIEDWCAETGHEWEERTGCWGLGVIST